MQPHILEQASQGDLDEPSREVALENLRKSNFRILRDWLLQVLTDSGRQRSSKPRLLDVGCAHGWFIDACADAFQASGIEPDVNVARAPQARGLDVRTGFFPQALDAGETFDIISFNDVLEHIPDVRSTLRECQARLPPGGLLLVNAPSRRGALYNIAKLLAKCGASGPFERMWQAGFPSPHVHYFDDACIRSLASVHGFHVHGSRRLASVGIDGLYSRIRYSRDASTVGAMIMTAMVAASIPLLRMLPADIQAWLLVRDDSPLPAN